MSAFTAQSILGIDIAKAKLDSHFVHVGSIAAMTTPRLAMST